MAASRAGLVISWKVMRFVPLGSFSTSMRCQEIASPSRSSSVASQIVSASAAAFEVRNDLFCVLGQFRK